MGGVIDAGKSLVHKAEKVGTKVVNKVEHTAHDLYDKGKAGLTSVKDKVEEVGYHALGKDTPDEWKKDQAVADRAKDAKGHLSPDLQKDISGIRDDQTRIRSVANYYGAQDDALRQKLGVGKDVMTWDGWANQAANLVGDVHKGDGVAGFLGKVTGANGELADGNKKVFNDIAPTTDSFLQNVDKFKNDKGQYDPQAFQAWVSSQPENLRGDERFQQGYENYAKARFATDPKDKAAYVTAGNIRLAQHEQRLLQPNIADAMHGGVVGDVLKAVGVPTLPGSQILVDPVLDNVTGQISTKAIPSPTLPNGQEISVDSDVKPQNGAIPKSIQGASPEARKVLDDAVRDSGLTPGQTKDTGATDYSDYDQRIKVLTAMILAYSAQG